MCMAVRVSKVALLPSTELSATQVEAALNASPQCRRSQQNFLHPESTDTVICKARKGQGGNTAGQHCHTTAQSDITSQELTSIHQGTLKMTLLRVTLCHYSFLYTFSSNYGRQSGSRRYPRFCCHFIPASAHIGFSIITLPMTVTWTLILTPVSLMAPTRLSASIFAISYSPTVFVILHVLPYPSDADSELLFVGHVCTFVSHDGIPPTISYPFTHLSQNLQGHYLHLVLNVVRGIIICLLAQPHTKLWTVYALQLKLKEIAICICPNSPQWQTLSQKPNALKNFQQHHPVCGFLFSVCLTKELSKHQQ